MEHVGTRHATHKKNGSISTKSPCRMSDVSRDIKVHQCKSQALPAPEAPSHWGAWWNSHALPGSLTVGALGEDVAELRIGELMDASLAVELSHAKRGVFKNEGTPKSSKLDHFWYGNPWFWGFPIYRNHQTMPNIYFHGRPSIFWAPLLALR